MTGGEQRLSFDEYLAAHGAALQRYAYVLAGDDADAADLVQAALIKAYRRWRTIGRMSAPHAYVQRILTHCYIDRHRRRAGREIALAELPDGPQPVDHATRTEDLDALARALNLLTAQQRAVVVLRHFVGLPDALIATELRCSTATVRSHASRALHRLRAHLTYPDLEIRP